MEWADGARAKRARAAEPRLDDRGQKAVAAPGS